MMRFLFIFVLDFPFHGDVMSSALNLKNIMLFVAVWRECYSNQKFIRKYCCCHYLGVKMCSEF